jgi:hypothetical protein
MQAELVFAQSVAKFANGLRIIVIEMVRRAKNFHSGETGRSDFTNQGVVQLLIQEPVGGKDALDQKSTLR